MSERAASIAPSSNGDPSRSKKEKKKRRKERIKAGLAAAAAETESFTSGVEGSQPVKITAPTKTTKESAGFFAPPVTSIRQGDPGRSSAVNESQPKYKYKYKYKIPPTTSLHPPIGNKPAPISTPLPSPITNLPPSLPKQSDMVVEKKKSKKRKAEEMDAGEVKGVEQIGDKVEKKKKKKRKAEDLVEGDVKGVAETVNQVEKEKSKKRKVTDDFVVEGGEAAVEVIGAEGDMAPKKKVKKAKRSEMEKIPISNGSINHTLPNHQTLPSQKLDIPASNAIRILPPAASNPYIISKIPPPPSSYSSFLTLPPPNASTATTTSTPALGHIKRKKTKNKKADTVRPVREESVNGMMIDPELVEEDVDGNGEGVVTREEQDVFGVGGTIPGGSGSKAKPRTAIVSGEPKTGGIVGNVTGNAWTGSNKYGSDQPEELATLLAETWMKPSVVKEWQAKGLIVRNGAYNALEQNLVKDALREYMMTHNLDIEDLKSIIDVKGRGSRTTTFFKEIALSVPYRTLSSISQYLRAHFATLSVKGPFSREEDEEIIRGREVEGKGWVEIGKGLDRRGEDVRKRYTNHLEIRGSKQNGGWTPEESLSLRSAIHTFCSENDRPLSLFSPNNEDNATSSGANSAPWNTISKMMHGTRSGQRCRDHWVEVLMKKEGEQSLRGGRSEDGAGQKRVQRWGVHENDRLLKCLAQLPPQTTIPQISWTKVHSLWQTIPELELPPSIPSNNPCPPRRTALPDSAIRSHEKTSPTKYALAGTLPMDEDEDEDQDGDEERGDRERGGRKDVPWTKVELKKRFKNMIKARPGEGLENMRVRDIVSILTTTMRKAFSRRKYQAALSTEVVEESDEGSKSGSGSESSDLESVKDGKEDE